jgi:signal transduction histidine kinase
MVLAPFLLPLVVHLAFAYPSGRVAEPGMRAVVVVAYCATAIAGIGRALFRDPFRDRYCWSNCTDNVFLVAPDRELTRFSEGLGWRSAALIGTVAAMMCGWRLITATSVARRTSWNVLVPATFALLALAATAVVVGFDRAGEPDDAHHRSLFVARAISVTALAIGIAWGLVRATRTSRAVARLADALGSAPMPGTLSAMLSNTLGDDGLSVAYRMSATGEYADAAGRRCAPRPEPNQAMTTIVRDGQPLAVVVHDRALASGHDLEREIGAAARLAVDNERLRAESLAQLEDLRASRARIVATGDATRQRIERDLHDGAQQRLLAALFELRLATKSDDAGVAARLDTAARQVEQALADLRNLAHGIYPAILTEAGLAPTLRTLADRAPVAVELADVADGRFPSGVEAAAYLVVAMTIECAAKWGATVVAVRIERSGDTLVAEVEHDGGGLPPSIVTHLADRVGALGGELTTGESFVRAELPCAS